MEQQFGREVRVRGKPQEKIGRGHRKQNPERKSGKGIVDQGYRKETSEEKLRREKLKTKSGMQLRKSLSRGGVGREARKRKSEDNMFGRAGNPEGKFGRHFGKIDSEEKRGRQHQKMKLFGRGDGNEHVEEKFGRKTKCATQEKNKQTT